MKLFRMFGAGSKKILAENHTAEGTVTSVGTCWWIKVNTKAARMGAMDGARFPHIVRFTVDSREERRHQIHPTRKNCSD